MAANKKYKRDYLDAVKNVIPTLYFTEDYNMNDPKNSVDIVNSITKKDIQNFTSKLIKNAKSYEIVFKPKK